MLTLACAAIWLAFGLLNHSLSPITGYRAGIDLVYLPAGIRLIIVLIARQWGAIGITVSNPILFYFEFGTYSALEICLNSLVTGFVPLLVVLVVLRLLALDHKLTTLRHIDLIVISVAVSVVTPIAFNLLFLAFGHQTVSLLLPSISAMIMGDFLGCFIVLFICKLLMFIKRSTLY